MVDYRWKGDEANLIRVAYSLPAQESKSWSTALAKALGRPLSLPEKNELPYYAQQQQQQAAARQHLARLDAELDGLVYQLYQLTDAEVALVEGA